MYPLSVRVGWWFNNRGPITLLLNWPIRPSVPFNLQQRKLRPPLCRVVSTIMWFFKSSHSHSFIIVSYPQHRSSRCNRLHESKDDWEWFVGQRHHASSSSWSQYIKFMQSSLEVNIPFGDPSFIFVALLYFLVYLSAPSICSLSFPTFILVFYAVTQGVRWMNVQLFVFSRQGEIKHNSLCWNSVKKSCLVSWDKLIT